MSLIYRTIQLESDPWCPSSSISCSKQQQSGHVAHGHVQLGFEYLQDACPMNSTKLNMKACT